MLTLLAEIMRGLQYDIRLLSSIELFETMGIFIRDRLPTYYMRAGRAILRNSWFYFFLSLTILYEISVVNHRKRKLELAGSELLRSESKDVNETTGSHFKSTISTKKVLPEKQTKKASRKGKGSTGSSFTIPRKKFEASQIPETYLPSSLPFSPFPATPYPVHPVSSFTHQIEVNRGMSYRHSYEHPLPGFGSSDMVNILEFGMEKD